MSPALPRFLVKGFDYEEWHIIVEARDSASAVLKAENIYLTDGFGNTDAFDRCTGGVSWKAIRLVEEVQR